jgi:flagellar biosynthesis protein FlhB
MAGRDGGEEPTEEPTEKRLNDAREKGQVARSRELVTTLMLLGGGGTLILLGGYIVQGLMALMVRGLQPARVDLADPSLMMSMFIVAIQDALLALLPFFIIMALLAAVSSGLTGGWSFSSKAMAPKFDKLNPIKGLGRMFGKNNLVELIKSILKFILIGVAAIILIRGQFGELLGLGMEPLQVGMAHAADILLWSFFTISAVTIILAAIDVPYQLWEHHSQLKMTLQEVKDEFKEAEGRPEVKQRIRQVQREMSQQRMMSDVPQADVVVTNPTHFAVALQYNQDSMRAPKVIAKGADLVAAKIRGVAAENHVPLVSSPPLARALYHAVEIQEDVPAGLYLAVAQVLAYVYQLKASGERMEDLSMNEVPVPDEFAIPESDV